MIPNVFSGETNQDSEPNLAVDPADPGIGACGPPGQDLWCKDELAGAWFNDAWKTLTYWGRLGLPFATPPQTLSAGSPSAAMTVETAQAGAVRTTPTALTVTLSSSSSAGLLSTSPDGPWTSTLAVTIPAGGDTSPAFYYEDTQAGNPVLTASAGLGVNLTQRISYCRGRPFAAESPCLFVVSVRGLPSASIQGRQCC